MGLQVDGSVQGRGRCPTPSPNLRGQVGRGESTSADVACKPQEARWTALAPSPLPQGAEGLLRRSRGPEGKAYWQEMPHPMSRMIDF